MITSLTNFIAVVDALEDRQDAYYIFEELCSPQLRDEIYQYADPSSPEPFRSAMIRLGYTDY